MTFAKYCLFGLLGLAILFVGFGLTLPQDYTITRRIQIEAPRDRVHAMVADLHQWSRWTPWQAQDETMKIEIGGLATGVGAKQSWQGERGSGSLTFTRCDGDGIGYDIWFDDGRYACASVIEYGDLADAVEVTWTMTGKAEVAIVGGYMAAAMDGMVGPMFELGLADLKKAVEATSADAVAPAANEPTQTVADD